MVDEPVEELSLQLAQLFRGLRSLHATIVESSGHQIETSAVALLANLAAIGPARLSTLASVMGLDLSTVSRQVPGLERQGWVARTRDPQDQRAQLLELTAAGHDMLQAVRVSRAEVLGRLLPDWSPADVRAFAAQLARFNDDVNTNRQAVLPALASARTERA